MAGDDPKTKNSTIKASMVAIVVAILGLVLYAINDSGKHWYYMLFTRADLRVKVYDDTTLIRGLMIHIDKDSSTTGTDGVAVFESLTKGNHKIYIKYKGDSVKKTITIPDTAKIYFDNETFNQTKSPPPVVIKKHPFKPGDKPVVVIDPKVPEVGKAKIDSPKKAEPPQAASAPVRERVFQETYCKEGHYVLFDSLKVWVDKVHMNESSANFQICYTKTLDQNCTNVIEEDIPIKSDAPFVFNDRKKGYKLRISRFNSKVALYVILEQYDKPFPK